jgi:tetratricopeptide (TPR) repeat protein
MIERISNRSTGRRGPTRWASIVLSGVVLAAGCASGPDPGVATIDPPFEADLSITDEDSSTQILELLEAAREEPGDARRRAELGMAYEVSGLIDASLVSYDQAAMLDPTEPRFSYYAALIRATRSGDLEAALASLDRVFAIEPNYAPAHLYRGQWLTDLDRPDEALVAYERATELEPEIPVGWIGQARIHLARGDAQKAVEILEALAPEQRNSGVYQVLGTAYRELGDLDRARETLALVKPGRYSEWPDRWHYEKAAYVTGYGAGVIAAKELIKTGRNAEAITLLNALRQKRPDDPDLLSELGVAYQNIGSPEEAIRAFELGLTIDPDYYPLQMNLGQYYANQGDYVSAVQHLDRAIEIHPALALAHEYRGLCMMHMQRAQEAYVSFQNAVAHDANSKTSLFNLAFIEANWRKQWDLAVDYVERVIAIDSSWGDAHVLHGWVLAERGDLDEAEQALARARELEPDSQRLQTIRGRVKELRSASR